MIRDYEKKDFKSVLDINKICFEKPEPSLQLAVQLDNSKIWVAVVDNKVVGFLISSYSTGNPYIYNIAIIPEYRGKHIGRDLIKEFENYYKGCGTPFLHVNANNDAKYLYIKLGYLVKTKHNNFYGQGEDALVMVKNV